MKSTVAFFLILLLLASTALAAPPAPPQPELNCRAAVLMDYETGRILFQKNADTAIPPASMTKLVTAYTFLLEAAGGRVDLDELLSVDKAGDYRSAPPQSSLMFLEEGQQVSGRDLLAGLAVPSGNDAAVAVAVYAAGSVEAFVELMNRRMEELGLVSTRFVEPSGYSEYNITTAGEFARFCREYLRTFPDISLETASLPDYTYPRPEHLGNGGTSTLGPITQTNHNELIGRYSWADGLKTGYIEESGYNVALTAEKDGRRLICVIMGIERVNSHDASLRRVVDGVNLLSYGFYAFTNFQILPPEMEPARVYGGKKKTVGITAEPSPTFTFSYPETASLRREYVPGPPIMAPVERGAEVGIWKVYLGEEELGSYPVTAAETVEQGGFFRRLWGKILFRFAGGQ